MPPVDLNDIAKFAEARTNELGKFAHSLHPVHITQASASAKGHLSDLFESVHALKETFSKAGVAGMVTFAASHSGELASVAGIATLIHTTLSGKTR